MGGCRPPPLSGADSRAASSLFKCRFAHDITYWLSAVSRGIARSRRVRQASSRFGVISRGQTADRAKVVESRVLHVRPVHCRSLGRQPFGRSPVADRTRRLTQSGVQVVRVVAQALLQQASPRGPAAAGSGGASSAFSRRKLSLIAVAELPPRKATAACWRPCVRPNAASKYGFHAGQGVAAAVAQ